MTTRLKIGPNDHGMSLSLEEFLSADGAEGYHYELIDGKLYVSPVPNLPQDSLEDWLSEKFHASSNKHPDIINYVTHKGRLFVPDRAEVTAPEPDLAAYHDFPRHLSHNQRDWRNLSPILVVEVVSEDDPDKDLVRNVELYAQVPSIEKYWILDGRDDADRPTLTVYRRRDRRRWRKALIVEAGATYTTDLLPGFTLLLDPFT
jgi:Uma2 family endonuclease